MEFYTKPKELGEADTAQSPEFIRSMGENKGLIGMAERIAHAIALRGTVQNNCPMRPPIRKVELNEGIITIDNTLIDQARIHAFIKPRLGLSIGDLANAVPDKPAARRETIGLRQPPIKVRRIGFKTQIDQSHAGGCHETPIGPQSSVRMAELFVCPAAVFLVKGRAVGQGRLALQGALYGGLSHT